MVDDDDDGSDHDDHSDNNDCENGDDDGFDGNARIGSDIGGTTTAFPRKEHLCIAWLGHLFASRTCPLFWLGPSKIHESLVPLVDTILPSTSWKCHACDWADFILKQDDQKGGPLGRIV